MMSKRTLYLLGLAFYFLATVGCKDQWDEHNETQDSSISRTLTEKIKQNAQLSTFMGYLERTGYDDSISNSKSYTIWAPSNEALQSLDPAMASDTSWLKKFVAGHISFLSYTTSQANDTLRVRTLGGKYQKFSGTKFENANIISANQPAKNGILHVVDGIVPPRLNIWEYIKALTVGQKQKNFMLSLESLQLDSSLAEVERYDPLGKPILKPGTGLVLRNRYFTKFANLADESKQYTFFVLTDAAFDAEYSRISPFYVSNNTLIDSLTQSYLTSFEILKDLVIKGKVTTQNFPAELNSTSGVRIPVTASVLANATKYEASNGIVYVLDAATFNLRDKFKSIKIEGESNSGRFIGNGTANGRPSFRNLKDLAGNPFTDIQVYDHRLSSFSLYYRVDNMRSGTYKVFWRAVAGTAGDRQTTVFQQQVGYSRGPLLTAPITYLGYKNVGLASDPASYNEVEVGTMTVNTYGLYAIYLNAAATASVNQNTLILDYIRLEPVLP